MTCYQSWNCEWQTCACSLTSLCLREVIILQCEVYFGETALILSGHGTKRHCLFCVFVFAHIKKSLRFTACSLNCGKHKDLQNITSSVWLKCGLFLNKCQSCFYSLSRTESVKDLNISDPICLKIWTEIVTPILPLWQDHFQRVNTWGCLWILIFILCVLDLDS